MYSISMQDLAMNLNKSSMTLKGLYQKMWIRMKLENKDWLKESWNNIAFKGSKEVGMDLDTTCDDKYQTGNAKKNTKENNIQYHQHINNWKICQR